MAWWKLWCRWMVRFNFFHFINLYLTCCFYNVNSKYLPITLSFLLSIYGMPSDATTILRIDPIKNEATTFGKVSNTINKWQGGVLSTVDNCVYAVPADMDCVLRIDTDPETPLNIDYVGGGRGSDDDEEEEFQKIDDKWQGGFLACNGERIYAIPENINNVMVITPGKKPRVEMLI